MEKQHRTFSSLTNVLWRRIIPKVTLKGKRAKMILSEMSTPIQRRLCTPKSFSDGDIPPQLQSSASLCIPSHFLTEKFRWNNRWQMYSTHSKHGTFSPFMGFSSRWRICTGWTHRKWFFLRCQLQFSAGYVSRSHFLTEIFRLNSNPAHRYVSRVTFWPKNSAGKTADRYTRHIPNTELSRHSRASLQGEEFAPAEPTSLLVLINVPRRIRTRSRE